MRLALACADRVCGNGINISKTARRLGVSRNTIYRALRGNKD